MRERLGFGATVKRRKPVSPLNFGVIGDFGNVDLTKAVEPYFRQVPRANHSDPAKPLPSLNALMKARTKQLIEYDGMTSYTSCFLLVEFN